MSSLQLTINPTALPLNTDNSVIQERVAYRGYSIISASSLLSERVLEM